MSAPTDSEHIRKPTMHTKKRLTIAYLAMAAALGVLFALNLFWGSVALSPAAVVRALLGRGQDVLASNILLQLRLPRAVMVVPEKLPIDQLCRFTMLESCAKATTISVTAEQM